MTITFTHKCPACGKQHECDYPQQVGVPFVHGIYCPQGKASYRTKPIGPVRSVRQKQFEEV